jgi:FkbM family methyltransferase
MKNPDEIELAQARLKILKHWFEGKKNGVSFTELLGKEFGRSFAMKAKSVIQSTRVIGTFLEVKFRGFQYPLYYPAEMPLHSLYQVVAETLFDDDWHYYESERTGIDRQDVVVDCGAGEGLFSLFAVKRCRKVYAIEPLPRFVQAMKLTFSAFCNVEIVQCALSDHEGIAHLHPSGISSSLSTHSFEDITVKIDTVDNLFFKKGIRVNFMKADLEGSEMEMLQGAYRTLKTYSPKIAITTYHKREHARKISDFLEKANPNYEINLRGLHANYGSFVMLHANAMNRP